jgi:formamidopyrimidine-DNA glycosylase
MPELPEVESARRFAEKALAGKRIVHVATVEDPIMYEGVRPKAFAQALTGRKIIAICRRGKHLWFQLDRRPWPAFHFGMTGDFHLYKNESDRPRFLKLELLLNTGRRFAMTDARRLGRIRLLNDPPGEPPVRDLAFDPFLDHIPAETFISALLPRKALIKAVLLDQSFAAGVGNWIADEILYQARINPHRRAADLSVEEAKRIFKGMIRIIRKAVEVNGDNDRYPRTWLFHYRWGKNPDARTAKGEKIIHETLATRTTAWVPSIQK